MYDVRENVVFMLSFEKFVIESPVEKNDYIYIIIKLHIPIMHCHFFRKYLKIVIIFKRIVTTEEILFVLHAVNGIHITIHNGNIA